MAAPIIPHVDAPAGRPEPLHYPIQQGEAMPLKSYGVLKGRPIDRRLGTKSNAHYHIHIIDDATDYRIAVNVKSSIEPSDLEYLIDDDFHHPITALLEPLKPGFTSIASKPGGLAIDFIRANLFDRSRMRPLPFNVPGPDNDLNEALDIYVQEAMSDETAHIYAFGERWGPEKSTKDKIFGFLPGNGIHDIHMNQGNDKTHAGEDGTWQDGAMLIHFPSSRRWIGVFLKFQSQTWHTDDATGHRIEPDTGTLGPDVTVIAGEPDGIVRIIGAMVNPPGPAPEKESVTLLNASPKRIDLNGWTIADRNKKKMPLTGALEPGGTLRVSLTKDLQLGNDGGIITLLDGRGLKVDGVSYTKEQAREGWTVVF